MSTFRPYLLGHYQVNYTTKMIKQHCQAHYRWLSVEECFAHIEGCGDGGCQAPRQTTTNDVN